MGSVYRKLKCSGGKNVKTEPNFGSTENSKSAIAASNAVQVTDPRDFDLANNVEKTSNMSGLTLKTREATVVSGSGGVATVGYMLYMDECAGRVLFFSLRYSIRISRSDVSLAV